MCARARHHVDAIITGDTPTVISAITHNQDLNANQKVAQATTTTNHGGVHGAFMVAMPPIAMTDNQR